MVPFGLGIFSVFSSKLETLSNENVPYFLQRTSRMACRLERQSIQKTEN